VAEPGAAPPQATDWAIDVKRMEALNALLGEAEFHRLARTFLGDLSRRVATMNRLGASGDLAALEHEAHSLKGTAGSYGLERVSTVAARLEAACAAATRDGVGPLLEDLGAAMTASADQLAQRFGIGA
jgi:HPt (histidine-containing phosphotransfer) domain-containing protein